MKQWNTNSAKILERLTRLRHSLESLLEEDIFSMGQAWYISGTFFCNIFHWLLAVPVKVLTVYL